MSTTADQWNARYPIGTPVVAYPLTRPEDNQPDYFERLETQTRSAAWALGHGEPVVMVDGHAGGIALTHVDPITDPAVAAHDRMVAGLDQVLDVEAGLAEVLSTAPTEDTQRAAATINDGLGNLFRRLGPPTDRSTEKES